MVSSNSNGVESIFNLVFNVVNVVNVLLYVVNLLLFDMYKEWNWEINILYLCNIYLGYYLRKGA